MTRQVYSGMELAKHLLPSSSDWTLTHVAAALENMTEWYVERGQKSVLDTAAVVREVGEMNMSYFSRDGILEQVAGLEFKCEWTLPKFEFGQSGFVLV